MKIKKKGKVHPTPSSSSSSSSSIDREALILSVLSLLPHNLLSLASVLSLEDREVLAYMLTRSLKTTSTPTSSSSSSCSSSSAKKKPSKKPQTSNNNGVSLHLYVHNKPPMFNCECFDCYTSFWVRWDTSPNHDLIHRVIEDFEDHLASGERPNSRPNKKRSRSDKLGRRELHKPTAAPAQAEAEDSAAATTAVPQPQNAVVSGPTATTRMTQEENEEEGCDGRSDDAVEAAVLRTMAASSGTEHRGLARKVLPDVLGLFNSRLWSLWSPNA